MAEVQNSRGPLFIRPGKRPALGPAVAKLEISQPLPLVVEPAPITNPYSTSRTHETAAKQWLGRGGQLDIRQSFPLTAPIVSFGDGDGSASGDATASGSFDALADFAGSASGDATASGSLNALGDFSGSASGDATASAEDGSITFPFSVWEELLNRRGSNRATKLGRGAQVEFKQPLPLAILNNQDGTGSASGDATASGTLDALADFAGSASGDATASGTIDALADQTGSASGDAIASGSLNALADQTGTATGDATASAEGDQIVFPFSVWEELKERRGPSRAVKLGRGSQVEFAKPLPLTIPVVSSDGTGAASGDATASGELDALADFAGTATGDAIASADGETVIDITGTAIGDAVVNGFIEDATPPVVVTPPAEGGAAATGVGTRAWASWYKSTQPRKKKKPEPIAVEAAIAAKEEADDRLAAIMAEKQVLLAHISELEFARYRAAAQADVKRAAAELALARELEDEDEAMIWLMAA